MAGSLVLSFGGTYFQHWKWQMTLSVAFMTFFGGLLAYANPERQGLAIAFAFLSAVGFGYAQYLSIAYIQFGKLLCRRTAMACQEYRRVW